MADSNAGDVIKVVALVAIVVVVIALTRQSAASHAARRERLFQRRKQRVFKRSHEHEHEHGVHNNGGDSRRVTTVTTTTVTAIDDETSDSSYGHGLQQGRDRHHRHKRHRRHESHRTRKQGKPQKPQRADGSTGQDHFSPGANVRPQHAFHRDHRRLLHMYGRHYSHCKRSVGIHVGGVGGVGGVAAELGARGAPVVSIVPRSVACTRAALLTGCNYYGDRQNRLDGCINDTLRWRDDILPTIGEFASVTRLTDDTPPDGPTMEAIVEGTERLIAQPAAMLLWMFSGHGVEQGPHHEGIAPLDFKTVGFIVDTRLRALMVDNPQLTARTLFTFWDCCHSGSMLDLQYHWTVAPDEESISSSASGSPYYSRRVIKHTKHHGREPVVDHVTIAFGACREDESDADAVVNRRACGAGTEAFSYCWLEHRGRVTWRILLMETTRRLAKYGQRPQLECSHFLELDAYITLG